MIQLNPEQEYVVQEAVKFYKDSSERVFQLIPQAVGRSGRSDKKGEAIIQTYSPSHYAITMAARQDYELFYKREMESRKAQSFPPYTFLASVTVSGKVEDTVIDNVYRLIDKLNEDLKDEAIILGPTTPFVPYENNNHIRLILLKYRHMEKVREVLGKLVKANAQKGSIALSINIDPYNF